MKVTQFAKASDHDENVDDGTVHSVPANIVVEELDDESRIGFPAILGDDHNGDVCAELSDRLGAPIFEIPTGSSSLFGLKLEDILFNTLGGAGVHISADNSAVDFEAGTGRVETVVVGQKSRPTPYSAD